MKLLDLLIVLVLVLLSLLGWQQAQYISTLQRAVFELQLRELGPDTQEEQDHQFDFWPNRSESLFKI